MPAQGELSGIHSFRLIMIAAADKSHAAAIASKGQG